MFIELVQRRNASRVAFDRNHALCSQRQQRAGEAARSGPDLHDRDAFEWSRGPRDAAGEVEVEEKILSERSTGGQTVTADYLAQRREVVDLAHAASARRAASRSAATRLDGFARPLPAMSNAVPWSGEVRTN